jgi:hypothetical protein
MTTRSESTIYTNNHDPAVVFEPLFFTLKKRTETTSNTPPTGVFIKKHQHHRNVHNSTERKETNKGTHSKTKTHTNTQTNKQTNKHTMAILRKLAILLVIVAAATTHAVQATEETATRPQLRRGAQWTCEVDKFSCKVDWECCSGWCDKHNNAYGVGVCKSWR